MGHAHNSRSALRIFSKFCRIKGTNRYMKILLVDFWEKNSLRQLNLFMPFLLFDGAWSKLSQATVTIGSLNSQDMISFMITTGSLNIQDMIRILKQWRHDFSVKHLCGGYCMDITWCLYVEVKIQDFFNDYYWIFKQSGHDFFHDYYWILKQSGHD